MGGTEASAGPAGAKAPVGLGRTGDAPRTRGRLRDGGYRAGARGRSAMLEGWALLVGSCSPHSPRGRAAWAGSPQRRSGRRRRRAGWWCGAVREGRRVLPRWDDRAGLGCSLREGAPRGAFPTPASSSATSHPPPDRWVEKFAEAGVRKCPLFLGGYSRNANNDTSAMLGT